MAKKKIVSPNILVHYNPSRPLVLAGDASLYVGAVFSHLVNGDCPIAFAFRKLLLNERNYSQVEKEALSLHFGINKFHKYLFGRLHISD